MQDGCLPGSNPGRARGVSLGFFFLGPRSVCGTPQQNTCRSVRSCSGPRREQSRTAGHQQREKERIPHGQKARVAKTRTQQQLSPWDLSRQLFHRRLLGPRGEGSFHQRLPFLRVLVAPGGIKNPQDPQRGTRVAAVSPEYHPKFIAPATAVYVCRCHPGEMQHRVRNMPSTAATEHTEI